MHLEIGDQLRKHRKSLKLNQQTIADQLNIDRSTYTCYEIGKTYPPLDTLVRLSRIYQVSIDELLGVNSEPSTIVAESAPVYDPGTPITLTQSERAILLKLRELDSESLRKVNEFIYECLNKLD